MSAPKQIDLLAHYDALCAERDRINAINLPREARLRDLNAQIEALQIEARKVADEIDDERGRERWIALKRDIKTLAPSIEKQRAKAA